MWQVASLAPPLESWLAGFPAAAPLPKNNVMIIIMSVAWCLVGDDNNNEGRLNNNDNEGRLNNNDNEGRLVAWCLREHAIFMH